MCDMFNGGVCLKPQGIAAGETAVFLLSKTILGARHAPASLESRRP